MKIARTRDDFTEAISKAIVTVSVPRLTLVTATEIKVSTSNPASISRYVEYGTI
jgi:hypothetical protein